jgi:Fic family protein
VCALEVNLSAQSPGNPANAQDGLYRTVTTFTWDAEKLQETLAAVRLRQAKLLGRMDAMGFQHRAEAVLETLTEDVLKSSEIEGEILDKQQVRSSIARRLGMDIGALAPADRNVEGVVEMMLDATQRYDDPLTEERLAVWHAALFPTGRSGLSTIIVGAWRGAASDPMQVVSGPIGREKVHYEAPHAGRLAAEMAFALQMRPVETMRWSASGATVSAVDDA